MAEAIVSIIVGRLTDLLNEEDQLLHGLRDGIQQILIELRQMKTFLRDVDSRISEYKIRNLVADIRELAYDAEHVVESFLIKTSSTKKNRRKHERKYTTKLRNIEKKMSLLFDLFRDFNLKSTEQSNSSSEAPGKLKRFYSYTTAEPEIFVGFHGDVECLVGHLVNESEDCYRLISICGMGGLCKTTIAQKIYNHSTIKTYFAGLAWVSISQKWHAKLVLQRIFICLVPQKKTEILNMDSDKLVENLRQLQQRKKCLIVLDDIWSTNAWDSLKEALTTENSLTKLILTSRNIDVAKHVNPKGFIYRPEFLSAEQSWELLQLKALPRGDYRDIKRMEELGRELVGNCAGLPLAIVILGGILVTKPSLTEWEKVYDDSLLSLKKGTRLGEDHQRELLDVLVWSYSDLPLQLKPCFLYLGKFHEDEWIDTQTLYQLWIAEGMVLSSDKREGETMMQVAESYMGELVHRSMVQVSFSSLESWLLKFQSCSLHDLMRDLVISQAKAESLFEVIDLREGSSSRPNPSVDFRSAYSRQLVVYFDEGCTRTKPDSHIVKKADKKRSILLFSEFARRGLPPILRSQVANFRLLRVFSLEGVRFDQQTVSGIHFCINFARVLGSLVYLRYLSVMNTNLLTFPSIRKLVLLQTLKLDTWTHINFPPWLSESILGKLERLRHLSLPDEGVHSLGKTFKLRFNGLSKLETLENFNTKWCEVKDLPKLIGLQQLVLKVEGSYYDVEEMMKYLKALALSSSCLRFLCLSIVTEDLRLQNGPHMLRQLLCDHYFNLQMLEIIGKLPELAQIFMQQQLHNTRIDGSVIHINALSLELSRLEEDPMPILEKLPSLSFNLAFVGKINGEEGADSYKVVHIPSIEILYLFRHNHSMNGFFWVWFSGNDFLNKSWNSIFWACVFYTNFLVLSVGQFETSDSPMDTYLHFTTLI